MMATRVMAVKIRTMSPPAQYTADALCVNQIDPAESREGGAGEDDEAHLSSEIEDSQSTFHEATQSRRAATMLFWT